ncbi:UNVERIFIED_CONTAM: hypothetical protein Sradi_3164400 [Sesamum radiatum]|uniref:Uncharacterized protein n=1 Tax=Sesamum radiatum TaxID=300843 RepID=A0AAW2REZ1_SESRA
MLVPVGPSFFLMPLCCILILEIAGIRKELESVAAYEEVVWCQRSKDLWQKEGDRNTGFFHRRASHSFQTNRTTKIKSLAGDWVTSDDGIKPCFISHFEKVYESSRTLIEHSQRDGALTTSCGR